MFKVGLFMNVIYSSKCNNIALLLRSISIVCGGRGAMMLEGRNRSGLPFDYIDRAEKNEKQR